MEYWTVSAAVKSFTVATAWLAGLEEGCWAERAAVIKKNDNVIIDFFIDLIFIYLLVINRIL